jgi:hypothetical protein
MSQVYPIYEVYIDESAQQSGPRYLVVGGIMLRKEHSPLFEQEILAARGPDILSHHVNGKNVGQPIELGWKEFTPGKDGKELRAYKRVVDAFFKFGTGFERAIFACAVIDTSVPGRYYSGEKGEIGFNRELYFHCLRLGRHRHFQNRVFEIYPDYRRTKWPLEQLQGYLTMGLRKHMPNDARPLPYRKVQYKLSHEWQALQVSDILIGAIQYRLNAFDSLSANQQRKELCEYILRKGQYLASCKPGAPKSKDWGAFRVWIRKHEK